MGNTKEQILEVLRQEREPMSIGEIGQKVGVSWATAKTNILELSQEGELRIKKFGKNWIIWLDPESAIKGSCAEYRV